MLSQSVSDHRVGRDVVDMWPVSCVRKRRLTTELAQASQPLSMQGPSPMCPVIYVMHGEQRASHFMGHHISVSAGSAMNGNSLQAETSPL